MITRCLNALNDRQEGQAMIKGPGTAFESGRFRGWRSERTVGWCQNLV